MTERIANDSAEVAACVDELLLREYPILEFDPTPTGIIDPCGIIKPHDVPEHCVLCFFQDVISKLREDSRTREVAATGSEVGRNAMYEIDFEGRRLAVFHPGVGASFAAAMLEEAIAFGCRKFIACGGAGVLDKEIARGHVVIPTSAIRDEGTSYHYLPPSREAQADALAVSAMEQVLEHRRIPYLKAKTWTTDAFYRETPAKRDLRKSEGCLVVEMEAAAFFAVAQFRGVRFGQLLYGGDSIATDSWDAREWKSTSARETLFWLAAQACLRL